MDMTLICILLLWLLITVKTWRMWKRIKELESSVRYFDNFQTSAQQMITGLYNKAKELEEKVNETSTDNQNK